MTFLLNIHGFDYLFFQEESKPFLYLLTTTSSKLLKCTFGDEDKTFTFSPLLNLSRVCLLQQAPLWTLSLAYRDPGYN